MKYLMSMLLFVALISCNQGPTVVEPVEHNHENHNGNSPDSDAMNPGEGAAADAEVHKIEVLEVLPTVNYVYLRVKELDSEYWIATLKMPVEVGATYFYEGGMYQENFLSKEHDRVFDKLILVNNLVPENHAPNAEAASNGQPASNTPIPPKSKSGKVALRDNGTISIMDLITNRDSFVGKIVKVQGKCTKVNASIMDRNWIHLDDGTNEGFDFIATTASTIAVGENVVLRGVLAIDKDFGAGYKYAYLLEDCDIIK